MKNIEAYITKCRMAYERGQPLVADDVYDRIVEGSTQKYKVGAKVDGERFPHPFIMRSLQKVFAGEDQAPAWNPKEPYVATPKLDGAAVSLQYLDGVLIQALTRGDGKEGLDITEKMKTIVPQSIGNLVFDGLRQITGEVVAPKTIENARNYAAGALNLKSVEEFRSRELTFVAYGLQPYLGRFWVEDMTFLDNWFNVITRSDYSEFPHDGTVFRIDKYKYFDELGFTAHHPRGAYAYKTREAGVVTKLLDVEWNTGKSGIVAPVAILEPINIGGATVSRATLHNFGFIQELGLEIGCNVEVIRSGEIIPKVVRRV